MELVFMLQGWQECRGRVLQGWHQNREGDIQYMLFKRCTILAAFAIIVSSDESVGSPPSWVIIFGDIPAVIPSISVVAPETSTTTLIISFAALVVGTTLVASPTGLYGLVPYLDSDWDSPDEMDSSEHITLLARRCVSPHSLDHHSSSSSLSSGSAPVHSSRFVASNQAHSGPSIRFVSPRLNYPLVRSPRYSKAFRFWCAASLSSFYPSTTSESSSGDSPERPRHLSLLSVGPSGKRFRSPADSVPSSTPITGSLGPTRADLLPHRKRFRDSYSPDTSMEEDTEINTTETEDGRELAIVDRDDVRDQVKVDPRDDMEEFEASTGDTVVFGIDSRLVEDIPVDLDGSIRDFYHHMYEVCVDRIVGIETAQRQLKADQMLASGARASMAESIRSLRSENLKIHDDRDDLWRSLRRTMTNTHSGMTPAAIEEIINQHVIKALEAHEINRNLGLKNLNGNGNYEMAMVMEIDEMVMNWVETEMEMKEMIMDGVEWKWK
nr:hypothetical protein [Tanacetum cinerariifolium]